MLRRDMRLARITERKSDCLIGVTIGRPYLGRLVGEITAPRRGLTGWVIASKGEQTVMRKTLVALVALAAMGFGSTAAFAHGPGGGMGGHMGGMGGHMGGMGGGHFGGGHFGGQFGGFHGGFHRHVFVGFGFGPSYYGGDPYYDNYDDEGCYLVRRRVLTHYGWRIRRVEVCS